MSKEKLNMTLSLKVEGKEEMNVTVEYLNTTLETVKLVENGLAELIKGLNE